MVAFQEERLVYRNIHKMSEDFVDWFFDNKAADIPAHMHLVTAACMWEGWKARGVESKFAGWGLYHAERDEFGAWLKASPQDAESLAVAKHGYVNVKLFTFPVVPEVGDD